MPDFDMCQNKTCTKAKICHRFTATPNPHRQWYGDFPKQDDECEQFIDNRERF